MKAMVSFFDLKRRYRRYEEPLQRVVRRVFNGGRFILGPEVENFEAAFAEYLQVKYVIGVNSGTDALCLALKGLGVGVGHEVITVANTATPTVSAIRMTGAVPVFVDVLPDTHTMDPTLIERAITSRTRAIVPVHLYGYPADMEHIMRVARLRNLVVVEDACQSHGALYAGQKVGTLGEAGCFSFYPTKNLGAFGDGGAVATNKGDLAERLHALRNYGEVVKFEAEYEGVNSRLDELQAAFLNWALRHVDRWNRRREEIALTYISGLCRTPLELPERSDRDRERVWHLFVVKADDRNGLQRFLRRRGIQTAIHYPIPVHQQRAYRSLGYVANDLPVTRRLADRILSLPLYPELTKAEVRRVCHATRDFFDRE